MLLGDARRGKLADNILGFGRALRRAGVRLDSARIALACEAAQLVGVERKPDLGAALEAVLVSRDQDRVVFRELFDAYFRDPEVAHKLLAQMLPSAEGRAEPSKRRPRVSEALSPQRAIGAQPPRPVEDTVEFDAAMTASDLQHLRHADFNALSASEYRLVERLARDIALPQPTLPARRSRPDVRGAYLHWRGALHDATRTGGELLRLPRLSRRVEPLPLLVLVDVSGSMERYARLLLAFLHAATRQVVGRRVRRDLYAFGTHLTELTPALRLADTDEMLIATSALIDDYGGGTCLGASLATLREQHARRLVGRRTLVLLVSDGLDTGEPEQLDAELAWLRRRCRRLLWLNPLLRYEGYAPLARGAATLHRHADGMLAIHNLSRLEDLASSLAALMTSR
ncbi:von Willebrand factor A [Hylemonella gracilis str. Niagara R]|uniref:von Willebrand factor A n=1 Tax=Hylemonella gracilis str. Niagara R TaxID=1458275 RepID=A0A016XGQ4_9BURK|nr:VWA domain-containing protein [Hylemonella gracilis]EYC51040.1 von Willebrand factor A [Hylemonella gracilis str. Niagara R]